MTISREKKVMKKAMELIKIWPDLTRKELSDLLALQFDLSSRYAYELAKDGGFAYQFKLGRPKKVVI